MPQPAEVEAHAEALVSVWAAASRWLEAEQTRILTSTDMTRDFGRRLDRLDNELIPAVTAEMERLRGRSEQWISENLPDVWRRGAQTARGADPFVWTLPHRAAVERLATDTYSEVLAATAYIQSDTARWARDVGKEFAALRATTGMTAREASRRMADTAQLRGISAIRYRDGTHRTPADYSDMLIRTKTAMAYNGGTLTETRQLGFTHVEIFDGLGCGIYGHNDGTEANGLVVPVEFAEAYPLAHPRCRRSFAPRPDQQAATVTDPGPAPGSFLYDPTPTLEQRQAQAAAEAARATENRQRAANRRTQRSGRVRARRVRSQQPARVRSTPAERALYDPDTFDRYQLANPTAVADARAAETARAARLADIETKEAAKAAKALERKRRRLTPADIDDIVAEYGITEAQWFEARLLTDELQKRVRDFARQESYDTNRYLLNNDVQFMRRPPPKVRHVDPSSGRVTYRQTANGYDFLEALDDAAERRLRESRMVAKEGGRDKFTGGTATGATPDELAARVRDITNQDFTDDEAIEWLLDLWDHQSAAENVANGRPVNYYRLDELAPPESEFAHYDIADILDTDKDRAAASIARSHRDQAISYAERELVDLNTGRPRPYDLDVADYLAELTDLEDRATRIRPTSTDPVFGETYSPADLSVLNRIRELTLDRLDDDDTPADLLHARIVELARQAGYIERPQ